MAIPVFTNKSIFCPLVIANFAINGPIIINIIFPQVFDCFLVIHVTCFSKYKIVTSINENIKGRIIILNPEVIVIVTVPIA